MEVLYYHENNLEKPYLPQEDYGLHGDRSFVVADGVTLDIKQGLDYPIPSDSYSAASIAASTIFSLLNEGNVDTDKMLQIFDQANKKVGEFNQRSKRWLGREQNLYSYGATLAAAVSIENGTMYYGNIEDCGVKLLRNGENILKISQRFPELIKYLKQVLHYDGKNPSHRHNRRKYITNNPDIQHGHGVLDGNPNALSYVNTGSIKLSSGDLVIVHTDGFTPALENIALINLLMHEPLTPNTTMWEKINKALRAGQHNEEKTAIFIKI